MAGMTRPKPKTFNYLYNDTSEDEDARGDGAPVAPEEFHVMHLEPRPFRPFKTSEEYLYAMKEDLAEWLNTLYGLEITVDNFMEQLETGIVLCQHANKMMQLIRERQAAGSLAHIQIPEKDVFYRTDVQPETFQARDNISNFITWCRKLAIKECLLFETDDLVLRKNERSFILCLLEVARCGARFGMLAPQLVLLEQEIDAELEFSGSNGDLYRTNGGVSSVSWSCQQNRAALLGLHEKVVNLLNRCTCPSQFPMIKVADGKYRIGDTKVLIFVRILRNHVMVRVGGGWDTLEHYLDKHDPCRCRSGHRTSTSARLTMSSGKGGSPSMQVTYNRPPQEFQQVGQIHTVTPYLVDYNNKDHGFASNLVHDNLQERPKQIPGGQKHRSRSFDNTSRYAESHQAKRYSPAIRKENSDGYSSMDYSKLPGNKMQPLSNVTNNILAKEHISYVQNGSTPKCANGKLPSQKMGTRSKIPCLGLTMVRAGHKSQSSEDLYNQRNFLDADDHWMRSRSSCSSPVHGAPHRNSFDSVPLGSITNKRSPHRGYETDCEHFARGPGQYSFRNPHKVPNYKTNAASGNKTWAFHQRSSQRPPLHSDWYPGSRIPSPKQMQQQNQQNSMQAAAKKANAGSPKSTSPHNLQRMTSDDEISSRAILRNMEILIDQYRSKLEEKIKDREVQQEENETQQQEDISLTGQETPPKRRQSTPNLSNGCGSLRGKMNRDSPGNSKIPIPQWYK